MNATDTIAIPDRQAIDRDAEALESLVDRAGRVWIGAGSPAVVYRIDTESKKIDRVIPVGSVPKFLAVSPDDSRLVVANWCSQDVSIIDTDTDREVKRIEVGLHPRGIAITKDSATAYVAVMGGAKIVRINLVDFSTHDITSVGATPRHLVLSQIGRASCRERV